MERKRVVLQYPQVPYCTVHSILQSLYPAILYGAIFVRTGTGMAVLVILFAGRVDLVDDREDNNHGLRLVCRLINVRRLPTQASEKYGKFSIE